MDNYIKVKSKLIENKIITDVKISEIYDYLIDGEIIVLKNVFNQSTVLKLKELAFDWAIKQDISDANDFYKLTNTNHYCVHKGVSKIQKTLHCYASLNFNNLGIKSDLFNSLIFHVKILTDFYRELINNDSSFVLDSSKIHPQIIHYPQGGGFFSKHIHSLRPQLFGLILGLSKFGNDYSSGGTGFEKPNGEIVDLEKDLDAGDIALFRYDLPHWVGSVDIEQSLNFNNTKGRWTLIIPHY
jgi:hypothetical protein